MTLARLLRIADRGYRTRGLTLTPYINLLLPDDRASRLTTDTLVELARGGDTLAQFIAAELIDTYDGTAAEKDQLTEAVRALSAAADDLDSVIEALTRAAGRPRTAVRLRRSLRCQGSRTIDHPYP
jgi:hypothetical protein